MRVRLAFIVAVTLCLPVWLGGQSSRTPSSPSSQQSDSDIPVFRTGVESVRFDAFVTDRHGKPVSGLTVDDFDVYEDGVLQVIQQFSPVLLPPPARASARQAPRLARDVALNEDDQDRIYVIVFDSLTWQEAVRATKMLERFLDDHFADSDMAALVTFDRVGAMRFTSNRAVLMAEADSFTRRFDSSTQRVRPGFPSNRFFQNRSFPTMDTIERATAFGEIAKGLGHINARRKSILFFSAGLDFDPYDAIDTPKSSFSEDSRAAMEPIMANNLTVYPIYPGVAGPMQLGRMRALARVTGATPVGSDYQKAFRQIVQDNSIYYVLGYESSNLRRDGSFRRIKVRMKRKDLNIRARDGYFVELPPETNPYRLIDWSGRSLPPRRFEPRSDMPPGLTKAITSPVALTAVPMKVFAAPHKTASKAGAITVVIEIPASGLDLASENGRLTGVVDVAVGAQVGTRTLRGTQFTYDINMNQAESDRLQRNGLRLTTEVTLEPGEYVLHVAAGARGGRAGKVLSELTVPDFGDQLLMMSGVSLTSKTAADVPTLQARAARAAALPAPAAALREFQRSDAVTVYAEVYENVWWTDAEHTITFRTELRNEDGRTIPMTSEKRSSTAVQKVNGHPFVATLPLADVPPGSYLLRVEGRSDFGRSPSVIREVAIEVR